MRTTQGHDPYGFSFSTQEYLLRSQGEYGTAELDWESGLLDDLAALQRPDAPSELTERVGARLREFLVAADWEVQEAAIQAALRAGEPVDITIQSSAAELYALPWELVTLRSSGQHLGELPSVLLHYEWPGLKPAAIDGPPPSRPILFVWSGAGGAVPAAAHTEALRAAADAAGVAFDPTQDVLPHVSPTALADRLRAAPPRILHILSHGVQKGANVGLGWNDGGGGTAVVDAAMLRRLLGPHLHAVKNVVLCACRSGDVGALGSRVGSLAQAIHRAGAEAVVASRFPLSADGSVRLTEVLYERLLASDPVNVSFVEARNRLIPGLGTDWASLQLHCRAEELNRSPMSDAPREIAGTASSSRMGPAPAFPEAPPAVAPLLSTRSAPGRVLLWSVALALLLGVGGLERCSTWSAVTATAVTPRPQPSADVHVLAMTPPSCPDPSRPYAAPEGTLPEGDFRAPTDFLPLHAGLVRGLAEGTSRPRSIVFDLNLGTTRAAEEIPGADGAPALTELAAAVEVAVSNGVGVVVAELPSEGDVRSAGLEPSTGRMHRALLEAGARVGVPRAIVADGVVRTVELGVWGETPAWSLSLLALLSPVDPESGPRSEPVWHREGDDIEVPTEPEPRRVPARWQPAWPDLGPGGGLGVTDLLGYVGGALHPDLAGKIVLVGWMCRDIDVVTTPVGEYNGVLAHAAAISGILTGERVREVPRWGRLLLVLLGGLGLALGVRRLGAGTRAVALLGGVAIGGGAASLALFAAHVHWPMTDAWVLAAGAAAALRTGTDA